MRPEKLRLLLMIPVVFGVLVSCKNPFSETNEIKKGTFKQTIVETGELASIDTRSFVLPLFGRYWYQMKIIGLLEQGTEVKAGDSIIQLDPSDIKKYIIDLEGNLQTQDANMDKLIVYQSNKRSEMDSNLKMAQASFNLKKLEMEYSRFESDRNKKIKELGFEQEKIKLAKVERSIVLNKIIASNELKIQKIQVYQMKRDLKNANAVLPTLTIRTPIPGIFQIAKNDQTGNLLKIGDQIWAGANMGNVPNLQWMKVKTTINEYDFYKIGLGQKVLVRLDATPDVTFKGEITDIAKLCHQKDAKSRQKVFDVEVKLLKSDERLKPGMTVSCEFFCKEQKNAFFVPLNCVETTEKGSFIYLKNGSGYLRVKVKTGASNNTHIVIKGDFHEGQDVIPIEEIDKQKEKN